MCMELNVIHGNDNFLEKNLMIGFMWIGGQQMHGERVKTRRTVSGPRWTYCVNLTHQVCWRIYCAPYGPPVALYHILPPPYYLRRTCCVIFVPAVSPLTPTSDLLCRADQEFWATIGPYTGGTSHRRSKPQEVRTQEVQATGGSSHVGPDTVDQLSGTGGPR